MTAVLTAAKVFITILLTLIITNVVPQTATPIAAPRANPSMAEVYIVFSKLIPFSLDLVSPECETVPVLALVPAVEVQDLAWP